MESGFCRFHHKVDDAAGHCHHLHHLHAFKVLAGLRGRRCKFAHLFGGGIGREIHAEAHLAVKIIVNGCLDPVHDIQLSLNHQELLVGGKAFFGEEQEQEQRQLLQVLQKS